MVPIDSKTIGIALLSSAVLASALTSLLNNFFLSRREAKDRKREASGLLQRTRSTASMLSQAIRVMEHDWSVRIDRRLHELRGMMLSREFTIATSDLRLDEAYRALEILEIEARKLTNNTIALGMLRDDPNTWITNEQGDTNTNFNPDFSHEFESRKGRQSTLIATVAVQSDRIVKTIAAEQEWLRRHFFRTMLNATGLPER